MNEYLLKLILVEHDDEIYEGVLLDYDDDNIYISTDGTKKVTNFFPTAECEITLSKALIVPDTSDMLRKMDQMRKRGKFVVNYGDTIH